MDNHELNLIPKDKGIKASNIRKIYFFLFIITLAFFLSGFFTGKAFAATDSQVWTTFPNSPDSNTTYPYQCIIKYGTVFYLIESPVKLFSNGSGIYLTDNTKTAKVYSTSVTSGPWSASSDLTGVGACKYYDNLLQANSDIYTNGQATTVFFSLTHQPTRVLPQALVQSQPQQVLQQVVGLLPILLVCLVGFLGLRKALTFLRETLQQA